MPTSRDPCVLVFEAGTPGELETCIQALQIDVPPRGQNPASEAREQQQIQHLLHALLHDGQIPLPVRLHKRQAPDFVLETGNLKIGVEATEAINPDYVRACVHPAAQQAGAVVDASLYKWGTQGRPTSQIREEAGRKQFTGYGWPSDTVEREFGQSILDVALTKQAKLSSHYARYDRDRLLVYHDQPSPAIHIDKACAYAAQRLAEYWSQSGFDTIYVHKHRWMLYFTREDSGVLHEFPKPDAPLAMDASAWKCLESLEKLYLKSLEHEYEFEQILSPSRPQSEFDDLPMYEDAPHFIHQEWLEERIRLFSQRGCEHLLQLPEGSRLKTASEIAACPLALEVLGEGALWHVVRGLREVTAGEGGGAISRLRKAMGSRPPAFEASAIAVLEYLSTFDHITHWVPDSRASSAILDELRGRT